jgi:hypothetical protein
MFNDVPTADQRVYVGCELEDGVYVAGDLYSYSEEVEETADRELILTGELTERAPDGKINALTDVSAVAVSARRIKYMRVSYIPGQDTTEAAFTESGHR